MSCHIFLFYFEENEEKNNKGYGDGIDGVCERWGEMKERWGNGHLIYLFIY